MSFLSRALPLAKHFRVFPLVPGSKIPAIKQYSSQATQDPKTIEQWSVRWPDANVGIATDDLLAIDIDNKGEKKGDDEVLLLELQGNILHPTYEQRTPTGGRHLIYRVDSPLKQGVNVLARGIDTRSRGGYVVGAGSVTERGVYTAQFRQIEKAPEWLVARLASQTKPRRADISASVSSRAAERAIDYLVNLAPLAVQGQGGDETTFKVACKLKDLGCDELLAHELMFERWNSRCSPPWSAEELRGKIANAYSYGQNSPGIDDPSVEFTPLTAASGDDPSCSKTDAPAPEVPHPFDLINREFAYIGGAHGYILWETTDPYGKFKIELIELAKFHTNEVKRRMQIGGENLQTTKLWMVSEARRQYDGICFDPSGDASPRFYNLWRGFSYSPLDRKPTAEEQGALDAFLSHIHENICSGNEEEARWFIGYFAHLFQRPWELPGSSIVLKGAKGVGKSSIPEILSVPMADYFMSVSRQDAILGQFNSECENKLLVVLEEAVWGGNPEKEAALKESVTSPEIWVEQKYERRKKVKNYMRIVIIGNNDWLVSASEDERRYAIFNVGESKKQDTAFFGRMKKLMVGDGPRLLIRYFQEFDISGLNFRQPPNTEGLSDQKDQSLNPVHQWWKDCLNEGRIIGISGSEFRSAWPEWAPKELVIEACAEYRRRRNITRYSPTHTEFTKLISKRCPSIEVRQKRTLDEDRTRTFFFPPLDKARAEWDRTGKQKTKWQSENDEEEILK